MSRLRWLGNLVYLVVSIGVKANAQSQIQRQPPATTSSTQNLSAAINVPLELATLKMEPFFLGYYGKVGMASFFVASKTKVPDYTKVYWSMVHVLARKYGCFLQSKLKRSEFTAFKCKDLRVIVFRLSEVGSNIVLSSRQFDENGFEIIVRDRKIVARYNLYDGSWPLFR